MQLLRLVGDHSVAQTGFELADDRHPNNLGLQLFCHAWKSLEFLCPNLASN